MGAGHANLGIPAGDFSTTTQGGHLYHFAEGATAGGFQTWVLLLNPNEAEAHATVTLMDTAGVAAEVELALPPMTRHSVSLDGLLPDAYDVSTTVTSDLPLAAERSMYWDPEAASLEVWQMRGGSSTSASPAPSNDWFLAEGSTGGGFDTWVLVQNPNEDPAVVGIDFVTQDGPAGHLDLNMPARSRSTLRLSDHVHDQFEVSTFVSADRPIVVERSMYWDMRAASSAFEAVEGHSNAGSARSGTVWLVPEGSSGGGFETFILIANNGEEEADAVLTFLTDSEAVGPFDLKVPPRSRMTVRLSDHAPNAFAASALVQASAPVVVERSMYWDMRAAASACEAMGGHSALGLDP